MPLLLTSLAKSGAMTSKNPTLKSLFKLVVSYNSLPEKTSSTLRTDMLQQISLTGGIYLTSKPPNQGHYKNDLRWDGLKELLEQVGPEAERLGVRLISGPADFRKTDLQHGRNYWLEVLDPLHRPGLALSNMYKSWLVDPQAIQDRRSFWEYAGSPPPVEPGKTPGVEYFGEGGNGPSRYKVEFDGIGELVDGNLQPCHTQKDRTVFSGAGWAMFVESPDGRLYAGPHVYGKLHHASFLGGRPVATAGEIVVVNGIVCAVTAKSGHYRPTLDDLHRFVLRYKDIPSSALIRPDLTDDSGPQGEPRFHWVGDFRQKGAQAARLRRDDVLAALPHWAKGEKFMSCVDAMTGVEKPRMRRILGMTG